MRSHFAGHAFRQIVRCQQANSEDSSHSGISLSLELIALPLQTRVSHTASLADLYAARRPCTHSAAHQTKRMGWRTERAQLEVTRAEQLQQRAVWGRQCSSSRHGAGSWDKTKSTRGKEQRVDSNFTEQNGGKTTWVKSPEVTPSLALAAHTIAQSPPVLPTRCALRWLASGVSCFFPSLDQLDSSSRFLRTAVVIQHRPALRQGFHSD
jgi:hypothetical protein